MPARTHGMSTTKTYKSWMEMKARCDKPKKKDYRRYGARGIRICKRWYRFENFLADMGVRPEGKTLDRIDANGHYEPGNVRWSTPSEQGNNRAESVKFNFRGEKLTIKEISQRTGIPYLTLRKRLKILHWSPEDAFVRGSRLLKPAAKENIPHKG